jgi:hypothetical protein
VSPEEGARQISVADTPILPKGDRTFKLGSGTTSEPGRYVKSLRGARDGAYRPSLVPHPRTTGRTRLFLGFEFTVYIIGPSHFCIFLRLLSSKIRRFNGLEPTDPSTLLLAGVLLIRLRAVAQRGKTLFSYGAGCTLPTASPCSGDRILGGLTCEFKKQGDGARRAGSRNSAPARP